MNETVDCLIKRIDLLGNALNNSVPQYDRKLSLHYDFGPYSVKKTWEAIFKPSHRGLGITMEAALLNLEEKLKEATMKQIETLSFSMQDYQQLKQERP